MSTDWRRWDEPGAPSVFHATGFPPPVHPAEADLFARHQGIPGHDQDRLSDARVLMIGAGGLGSWAGVGLVRSGIRELTIVDPDRYDRTNAPRQLLYGTDLGEYKAVALARNLAAHMVLPGTVTGIPAAFDEHMFEARPSDGFDLVLVLVDNNRCRWEASTFARRRQVPAVFAMLSVDGGMRMHHFLQGSSRSDACLWCALPNLVPDGSTPCALGVISSCLAAAGVTIFLAHRALMGWATEESAYNWREDHLGGGFPSRVGVIGPRARCPRCASDEPSAADDQSPRKRGQEHDDSWPVV